MNDLFDKRFIDEMLSLSQRAVNILSEIKKKKAEREAKASNTSSKKDEKIMISHLEKHDSFKGNWADAFWYQFCSSKRLPKDLLHSLELSIEASLTPPTLAPTSSNEKDWEIECIQHGNKNYWRKQDGLYNSDLFVGGTSSEWLLNNGGTIFQVTRKSDGVVFSVGDKHSGTSYKDRTIEGFILLNNEIIIKQHGGNTLLSDAQPLPNTTSKRPPLGLMPMDIWKEQRLDDINAAIIRYAEANLSIPADWIYERADLLEFITQKK